MRANPVDHMRSMAVKATLGWHRRTRWKGSAVAGELGSHTTIPRGRNSRPSHYYCVRPNTSRQRSGIQWEDDSRVQEEHALRLVLLLTTCHHHREWCWSCSSARFLPLAAANLYLARPCDLTRKSSWVAGTIATRSVPSNSQASPPRPPSRSLLDSAVPVLAHPSFQGGRPAAITPVFSLSSPLFTRLHNNNLFSLAS